MNPLVLWQKARKDPRSGDLAVGLVVYFAARGIPAWIGAWQPSGIEAAAVGVAAGLISLCFDLMPAEND